MATLKTDISIDLLTTLLNSSEGRSAPARQRIAQTFSLANGTGASGTADLVYYDERTITSSASETLDFSGSLTDIFGTSLVMAKIKLIAVQNQTLTDGVDMEFGPDPTNGFAGFWNAATDRDVVHAGRVAQDYGITILYDPNGQTVGAGASDELQFTNLSTTTSVVYRILVVGTSA